MKINSSGNGIGITIIGEEISVNYQVLEKKYRSIKEHILNGLLKNITYRTIRALENVSVSVSQGEILGIVGNNGAGKSTLLKVLSGVIHPTSGKVIVRGNVGLILGLGTGLDPELSGRENIFLSSALMGFSKNQVKDKVNQIVEFAEIEDFVDVPLRAYSDGMVARLAFSIATDIRPDVLLIDEAFSVGDINFRNKCLERLDLFRDQGISIAIVSHDLQTLMEISNKAIWLEKGKIIASGNPGTVISKYKDTKS